VNGTTLQPATVTMDERNQLARAAIQVADGRVRVVAQIRWRCSKCLDSRCPMRLGRDTGRPKHLAGTRAKRLA
jgi:hypothetical protein